LEADVPFRLIGEFEALTSDDLDILQDAYEAAVERVDRLDDMAIHHAVETMIAHYRLGTTDREELAEIARQEIRRMAG